GEIPLQGDVEAHRLLCFQGRVATGDFPVGNVDAGARAPLVVGGTADAGGGGYPQFEVIAQVEVEVSARQYVGEFIGYSDAFAQHGAAAGVIGLLHPGADDEIAPVELGGGHGVGGDDVLLDEDGIGGGNHRIGEGAGGGPGLAQRDIVEIGGADGIGGIAIPAAARVETGDVDGRGERADRRGGDVAVPFPGIVLGTHLECRIATEPLNGALAIELELVGVDIQRLHIVKADGGGESDAGQVAVEGQLRILDIAEVVARHGAATHAAGDRQIHAEFGFGAAEAPFHQTGPQLQIRPQGVGEGGILI